jgi:hypothetical protein
MNFSSYVVGYFAFRLKWHAIKPYIGMEMSVIADGTAEWPDRKSVVHNGVVMGRVPIEHQLVVGVGSLLRIDGVAHKTVKGPAVPCTNIL